MFCDLDFYDFSNSIKKLKILCIQKDLILFLNMGAIPCGCNSTSSSTIYSFIIIRLELIMTSQIGNMIHLFIFVLTRCLILNIKELLIISI